ncbi:MAG: ABC transporter permease subunit [Christensenellaceae bacterium]
MLFANIVGVNGPVASLMQKILGLERVPELLGQDEYALGTIVVYCIWTGFGTNLILLNGAMARIPAEVLEAARLDGAGRVRELFQIILPLTWPTLTTLITFTFIGIFTASGPILLLRAARIKRRRSPFGYLIKSIIPPVVTCRAMRPQ